MSPGSDLRDGAVLVQAVTVEVRGTDVEIVEVKYGWASDSAASASPSTHVRQSTDQKRSGTYLNG